jgi:hypothetical protein
MLRRPYAERAFTQARDLVLSFADAGFGGIAQARAVLDECEAKQPERVPIWVPLRLMTIGEPQRALDLIASGPTQDDAGLFMDFWKPSRADVRRLTSFAAFARTICFAALWDKYGAPDACGRNAAGDYICN